MGRNLLGKKRGDKKRPAFDPDIDTVFQEVRHAWDSSVVAAYRTKGLRAWHDHLLLNLQKNIYFTCLIISLLFLVNEAQMVDCDPGKMDFTFVCSPILWACALDAFTVFGNCLYLCTRFVHEHHLEEFKEPRMIERLLLHLIPVPILVLFTLVTFFVPRCVLTPRTKHVPFCNIFSFSVLKVVVMFALVCEVARTVYDATHSWRHTSPPQRWQRVNREGGQHASVEFSALLDESDDSEPSFSSSRRGSVKLTT